jgi:hypothetical protein
MPGDEYVLDLLAEHLGRLRRADLAGVTRPAPLEPTLDGAAKRRARRDRLNNRKRVLTAESSARWANAIIGDDQYRLARDAEYRDVIGLRAAIATIEERLSQPTGDTLTPDQSTERNKARVPKGYPTQAERFPETAPAAGAAGPTRHHKAPTATTTLCTSPRAANGWPTPGTTSTPRR